MSDKTLLEDDDGTPYIEEDELDESRRSTPRWIPALVVTTALAGFVALAWYAYTAGTQSLDEGELLLVEADPTPLKEVPEDKGGMQFPHQDKAIFGALNGEDTPQPVERVMPSPETPVNIAEAGADADNVWVNESLRDMSAEGREALIVSPSEGGGEEPPLAASQPSVKVEEEPKTVAVVETPAEPEAKPEPKKVDLPKAEPAPQPKATAKAGSGTVQLAAFRSEAEANKAWAAVSDKHTILRDVAHEVVKADLGDKGVYYRLRVTGVDAAATCASLKAAGQACMVVK